jgi:CRP/FNR family transcriptional regulator
MLVTPVELQHPAMPLRAGTGHAAAKTTQPHCSHCHLRAWCLPAELDNSDADCMDSLIFGRRRIKTGERLYREGESFKYLYEVRSGNLKSSLRAANGRERVSAFHMAGELIGLDGLAEGQHASTSTALEDTEVCAVSYEFLTELAESNAQLQRTLMELLSREIVRELRLKALLGSTSAEERVATFLLHLSHSLAVRGYAPNDFHLRMSRTDIGSYLGLSLETVCRTFSALQKMGLLEVDQRHIRITNPDGLKCIADVNAARTGA